MKRIHRPAIIGLLLSLTFCALAVDLRAHHIRGIPHYSYKNNYPETPVYEVVEQEDNWTVTFTYYSIPGQQALDLAIYIRDTANDLVYEDPVSFLVFGKHEDPELSHTYVAYRNPTNIYKVGWVYEEAGEYFVRVTFDDKGVTRNVLFDLSVDQGNAAWMVLLVSASTVVLFAIVVGIVRKRKSIMETRR